MYRARSCTGLGPVPGMSPYPRPLGTRTPPVQYTMAGRTVVHRRQIARLAVKGVKVCVSGSQPSVTGTTVRLRGHGCRQRGSGVLAGLPRGAKVARIENNPLANTRLVVTLVLPEQNLAVLVTFGTLSPPDNFRPHAHQNTGTTVKRHSGSSSQIWPSSSDMPEYG